MPSHGEHLVYVSTFPPNICYQIFSQALEACNVDMSLNESILEGIRTIGNSDAVQKDEKAVYTANLGILVQPQRPTTKNTSPCSQAIGILLGSHRGGLVVVPEIMFSLLTPVRELYQLDFLLVFLQDDLPALDRGWYGPSANGKRPCTPRFQSCESHNTFKVFHPMVTSLP
jgi:hypothetical protein